jgi:hypothetical protein
MQIGDKTVFGRYEWRVLDVQTDTVLIITEHIIAQRSYHDKLVNITWADCSLRSYLNNEFYNGFDEADKSRILPIVNRNPDNHWYGTNCGEDTTDRIFLLDIEDVVCKYFGDSSAKLYNRGKNHRYWFHGKSDANNSKRIATYVGKPLGSWWWLRSLGRNNLKAVYVHGNGDIGIQGNNMVKGNISDGKCCGGVRPALWLRVY